MLKKSTSDATYCVKFKRGFVMLPNAQDALPLPRRPNVERYKNLAKDLVKACKSDDEDVIVAWAEKWVTVLAKQCGLEFIRPLPVIVSR